MDKNKTLRILGTRGVPAQHGGFETFAEHLALYLTRHDWNVTVYCQDEGDGGIFTEEWQGIELIHVPIKNKGALGTILFDWRTTLHAARRQGGILTLGYNTAIFCVLYRLLKLRNIINMDGLEWQREKWSLAARIWLYVNERIGCLAGNHLIADHPEIQKHLATRVRPGKITMIPYGANHIDSADQALLEPYGLHPREYAIVIARPEPENSILEIVAGFSRRARGKKLVVLGNFDKANPEYRKQVFAAASAEVLFPGAVYDQPVVQALRYFASLYIHGHQVGGTNPSLVEALGAGMPILAHNNRYNHWVAGNDNHYFANADECAQSLDFLLENAALLEQMRVKNRQRHLDCFTWEHILAQYEQVLSEQL